MLPIVFAITVFFILIWFLFIERKRIIIAKKRYWPNIVSILIACSIPFLIIYYKFFSKDVDNYHELISIIFSIVCLLLGSITGLLLSSKWDNENSLIIKSWMDESIYKSISKIKGKLVLIQTWFPDAANIAEHLKSYADSNEIEIEIFLLNPNSNFGKSRFDSIYGKYNSILHGSFNDQSFACLDNLIVRFEKMENAKVTIYGYDIEPLHKIYKIDEKLIYYSHYNAYQESTSSQVEIIRKKHKKFDKLSKYINELKLKSDKLYEKN